MKRLQPVRSFEQIKILADPRRLEILRLLMAAPATLTQLAQQMHQSPAWVRHHILALQAVGLIEIAEIRRTGKVLEKFYRARAGALLLQEVLLPEMDKKAVIFAGSDDLALPLIAEALEKHLVLYNLSLGSLDGLITLRQGLAQLSGAHLLDKSGEYNLPFLERLFPDRPVTVVTLAHRMQGLMLAPGNPKGIHDLADLARADVRFVNRNPGSGTRLWLDRRLQELGIPPEAVTGYADQVGTHVEAAQHVAQGQADVALGLEAVARRFGLAFQPLFQERYDLVFLDEYERDLRPLLDYVQGAHFRQQLADLPGYESRHSGEQRQFLTSW